MRAFDADLGICIDLVIHHRRTERLTCSAREREMPMNGISGASPRPPTPEPAQNIRSTPTSEQRQRSQYAQQQAPGNRQQLRAPETGKGTVVDTMG